jgi:Flp pilus assembly protein TadG
MSMSRLSGHAWRLCAARALADRRGSIAPMFALLAIPLLMAAGASVDLARLSSVHGQVQDIADSAALAGAYQFTTIDASSATAAENQATKYVSSIAKTLSGSPTVTALAPVTSSSGSCNLTAPTAPAGAVVFQVCATTPSAPDYVGKVQVAITYNIKTTLMAMVKSAMPAAGLATAQGGVARKVTVNVSQFSTDAWDLDEIYFYPVPTDASGTMLTGRSLYQYDPSSTVLSGQTSAVLAGATPILSNKAGFNNATSITLQVPYGSRPAFALYNTTGGVHGYGSNCYGQAQGQVKHYFSTREDVTPNISNQTQYYDYQSAGFSACGGGNYGDTNVNVTNPAGTDAYLSLANCTISPVYGTGYYRNQVVGYNNSCRTGYSYSGPKNFLYGWVGSSDYSRNPLQYGILNRNSSGTPTGGTTDGAMNMDCSSGNVTYNWDDNGGGSDDNDFNDIVFSVNCQQTTVLNTSVRLLT